MMGIDKWCSKLLEPTSILPLAIFRMVFGFLMCFSQIRFLCKGWVEDCFLAPRFHFTYHYFEWIRPFGTSAMYAIVIGSAVLALFIGLGLFYRVSSMLFFLSFTYLELIEKSWYLNHYYFASLVAFLLIWLPAHRNYSIDTLTFKSIRSNNVPHWTTVVLKLQIAVVYIFGGIAKLKPDWLLEAQPLKIWLRTKADLPVLGDLFTYDTTAFLFGWGGMLYDLAIPFLLWHKRSRPWAYILVVVFHVLTYMLFNIGMFPWIMIAGSLIFVTADEWESLFQKFHIPLKNPRTPSKPLHTGKFVLPLLCLYFIFQFTFPLRHFVLSNNVLWSENGIRFAWHVMVMEKNGFAEFTVIDNATQQKFTVYPSQYLTEIQEKQMAFQPDMIWQFAKYLGKKINNDGTKDLSVYVNSKVSLNGRGSRTYIDPKIDLLKITAMNDVYDYVLSPNDL